MRTWWDHDGLTVNGYHHGRGFTHGTPAHTYMTACELNERCIYLKSKHMDGNDIPADEGFDALTSDGCHAHGHGLRGGEPVGVVITGGKIAHIVDVTEQEGHGAELP